MGARRAAAVASSVSEDSTRSTIGEPAAEWGHGVEGGIGAAVTALQNCIVWTRHATLAAVGAALRVSFMMYRYVPMTISSVYRCALLAKLPATTGRVRAEVLYRISVAIQTLPFEL